MYIFSTLYARILRNEKFSKKLFCPQLLLGRISKIDRNFHFVQLNTQKINFKKSADLSKNLKFPYSENPVLRNLEKQKGPPFCFSRFRSTGFSEYGIFQLFTKIHFFLNFTFSDFTCMKQNFT